MKAFISYSHADERALERLHKHLAMLRRDELLSAWVDQEILPGSNLNETIRAHLDESDLFLALVSPDYLDSNYCYEMEFAHALSRSQEGVMKIVPIILEPSDWLSSPLRQFMALPKDGKPISDWTNANNAYLDVVNGLRKLLSATPDAHAQRVAKTTPTATENSARRIKLKRDFDAIERAEFADRTYEALRSYFAAASQELSQASDDLRTRQEVISPTAFTCTIVNRAKFGNQEASITVHNGKRRGGFGDISYVFEAHAPANTSNGTIRVEADEFNLYLVVDNFWGGGGNRDTVKYTPELAAEWLWNAFVERAGVQYE